MQRQPNTLKGINMKNLLLPAKIIGTAWIIFLIFIRPLAPSSEQDAWIWFALNAVGSASIAFVYGYSRGKKGLNAGWIAKVFWCCPRKYAAEKNQAASRQRIV